MDQPAPVADDHPATITAWICWQVVVHGADTAQIAFTLNDLGIPAWMGEATWTETNVSDVIGREER